MRCTDSRVVRGIYTDTGLQQLLLQLDSDVTNRPTSTSLVTWTQLPPWLIVAIIIIVIVWRLMLLLHFADMCCYTRGKSQIGWTKFTCLLRRRRRMFRIDSQTRCMGPHPFYRALRRRELLNPTKLAWLTLSESRLLAASALSHSVRQQYW